MSILKFGLNKNLLVVDDEEDLREAMSYDFSNKGFTVYTSCDGNEAMEIMKTHKIDVVVSDIQMPLCDGICLLKKVNSLSHKKPIFLLMSGFSSYTQGQVEELGALTLIAKPINRKEMFQLIEDALKQKDA